MSLSYVGVALLPDVGTFRRLADGEGSVVERAGPCGVDRREVVVLGDPFVEFASLAAPPRGCGLKLLFDSIRVVLVVAGAGSEGICIVAESADLVGQVLWVGGEDCAEGVTLGVEAGKARRERNCGSVGDFVLGCQAVDLTAEETTPGTVRMHVRDYGNGLPDEFLSKAFERFSRPDSARGADPG